MALSLKRALLPAVCRYAFTNFQVDIYVNVIEDDGSVLAAAITASGLGAISFSIYLILFSNTLQVKPMFSFLFHTI